MSDMVLFRRHAPLYTTSRQGAAFIVSPVPLPSPLPAPRPLIISNLLPSLVLGSLRLLAPLDRSSPLHTQKLSTFSTLLHLRHTTFRHIISCSQSQKKRMDQGEFRALFGQEQRQHNNEITGESSQ